MLVIEKAIHAHKNDHEFEVCVSAYGTKRHVADFIEYQIRCHLPAKPSKKKAKTVGIMTFNIDGMNDEFSKADAAEFRAMFKTWMLNPASSLSYQ